MSLLIRAGIICLQLVIDDLQETGPEIWVHLLALLGCRSGSQRYPQNPLIRRFFFP